LQTQITTYTKYCAHTVNGKTIPLQA